MNIEYKSDQIRDYYTQSRIQWEHFYPSERFIFERAGASGLGAVLDVGCAAGGLAWALKEKFQLLDYTGVDINRQAIEAARANPASNQSAFFHADILDAVALKERKFDTVVSLSCADWNLETERILDACWSRVKPGGRLIVSLRLTDGDSVNDMERSFQYIDFTGAGHTGDDSEKANYVVLNVFDALRIFQRYTPELLLAYGYWGPPSSSARTPFQRLAFTVLMATRSLKSNPTTITELHLPLDLLCSAGSPCR